MFYIDNDLDLAEKFDYTKFMERIDDVYDPLNSYMLYAIPKLPLSGYYTITTQEKRPDLISYELYGDTQYWWIILWYNHLSNPMQLVTGLTIGYPNINNLEALYMNGSINQKVQ